MKVIPETRCVRTKFDIYVIIIDISCLSTTNDNYAHKPLLLLEQIFSFKFFSFYFLEARKPEAYTG
jgi:hypothetical protein